MFSKHLRKSLPSIKYGLFHYIESFDWRTKKKIEEIARKYYFGLGDDKVKGLNYLFTNRFITIEQADLLAKQLVNWKGMCERQQSVFFTGDHMDALIALIQDKNIRQIPIDQVVNHLHLLTSAQARRIANGLTREEAITNLPFDDLDQNKNTTFNYLG